MASLNRVMLIGRVGKEPECKTLNNGTAVCSMSVATSESYKDRDGVRQTSTEWHRVTFFGTPASFAEQYVHKGSLVYIEGSISSRKYTGKDGVERTITEIKGQRIQSFDKLESKHSMPQSNQQWPLPSEEPEIAQDDSQVPF